MSMLEVVEAHFETHRGSAHGNYRSTELSCCVLQMAASFEVGLFCFLAPLIDGGTKRKTRGSEKLRLVSVLRCRSFGIDAELGRSFLLLLQP